MKLIRSNPRWRRALAALVLGAGSLLLPGISASAADGAPTSRPSVARKPNVIVLLADDLGYADVGVQGQLADVRTPNIDAIARGGARFTNGYVSCPVCSPTRAGFLTGRYQQRFGHEFNPAGTPAEVFGLRKDQVTIADRLKAAGYVTGMFGKWHEGTRDGYTPTDRGFDEFFGFLGGAHAYVNNDAPRDGPNAIRRGKTPVGEPEYLTDAIGREAAAFVERNKARPFFAYVSFNAVHNPQQAPARYLDRFPDEPDRNRHFLLAKLSAADDAVGRILKAVRDNGLERDTLIFFFSDNGGPTMTNGSRNKPFSGFKAQTLEGGIRVPFLAQWTGHIAAGQTLDQPVIALDVLPTAVAAAGGTIAPSDPPLDGVDLLPLLEGKTTARPHDALYWRFGEQWAIRDGDYKLVKSVVSPDVGLFDLSTDPGEQHDLTKQLPDVARRLKAKYDVWSGQLAEPAWTGRGGIGGTDARRLRNGGAATTGPASRESGDNDD